MVHRFTRSKQNIGLKFKSIFRVEGFGAATIVEVTFQEKNVDKVTDNSGTELVKEQIKDVTHSIKKLEAEKTRVQQKKNIILGLGEQVKSGAPSNSEVCDCSIDHHFTLH